MQNMTIIDPQQWHAALVAILAVPGLARNQRVTLRRDGRDIEVFEQYWFTFHFFP